MGIAVPFLSFYDPSILVLYILRPGLIPRAASFVKERLVGASPDKIWVRRDFPEAGLIKLLLIKCRRRPLCSVPQSCCVTIVTPRLTTTFHTTLPWVSANFVVIFLCLKLTSLVIFSNFFRGIHS